MKKMLGCSLVLAATVVMGTGCRSQQMAQCGTVQGGNTGVHAPLVYEEEIHSDADGTVEKAADGTDEKADGTDEKADDTGNSADADVAQKKTDAGVTVPVTELATDLDTETDIGSDTESDTEPGTESVIERNAADALEYEPISGAGTINGLEYHVIDETCTGDNLIRGFDLFGISGDKYPYKVVVMSGEYSTGGYTIELIGLKYDGEEDLTVVVRETAPSPTDVVTQAITYPWCAVELKKLPEHIRVFSEQGEEFEHLCTELSSDEIGDDWIYILESGAGEIMYKTYVYETEGDKAYRYIHVEAHTVSWGNPAWREIVREIGSASTKEEIIEKSKEFGSFRTIVYPDDYRDEASDRLPNE